MYYKYIKLHEALLVKFNLYIGYVSQIIDFTSYILPRNIEFVNNSEKLLIMRWVKHDHKTIAFSIYSTSSNYFILKKLSNHADMAGYVAQNLNQREQNFRERRECGVDHSCNTTTPPLLLNTFR